MSDACPVKFAVVIVMTEVSISFTGGMKISGISSGKAPDDEFEITGELNIH